ncbi:MAG: hypothetical protein QGH51_10115, partial [Planctomycetota bacterium]|nr:hypothetical protein [Planctomycetota bacterium]
EVAKEIRGISSTKKTQADALYYKCLIETSEIALAISELEGRISELENLPRIQEGDDGDLLLMNRFGVALMQNNNPEYYNRAHKIFQRVEKEYMRRGFQKTTSALLNQLNLAQLETKAKGLGNPTQRLLKAIRVIREKELDSWLETSFFYHALAQAYHYHEFNCEEDAVEWYRKALQQRKIQFGELLPSSLIIKAELALLLFNIGEAKEATREAEEYLSFVQGKKSDHRATDLEGYGAILQKELKNNVMKK